MSGVPLQPLLLRADAGTQMGAGHIMRCLALAQAWQDAGGAAHFATVKLPDGLAVRLAAEGMALHWLEVSPGSKEDAAQVALLAKELNSAWVVEDGYHFGMDYQCTIKDAGLRLLAIDDYGHAGHYVADLVLNQNIYADASLYPSRNPATRLLLGTQYVLLRREFLRWRGWHRMIPDVARKILVTMGGSDQDNVTVKALEALEQIQFDGLKIVVVVGASNPHMPVLQTAVQRLPHRTRIDQNVADMPELMAWADVAIAAGGSTCWEMAFMGLPSLSLTLARNQTAVSTALNATGVTLALGWHSVLDTSEIALPLEGLLLSPDRRLEMSRRGQELVDGNGAARVTNLLHCSEMRLRLVQPEDCRLIWEWANDPVTRAQSFSSERIPWESHQKWFKERLSDPMAHFYVAVDENEAPIGQIRFQVEGDAATISLNLAPKARGKGLGAEVIRHGSHKLFETTQVALIHAYIMTDNQASIGAFSKAGYTRADSVEGQGISSVHFVLRRA